MGNTIGQIFRVTTFGESHGGGVGVVIDGCPPQLHISVDLIQRELNRRRPGQSKITTSRQEEDVVKIFSGVKNDITLGTPIMMLVLNKDARPEDYKNFHNKFRPSHADFTYWQKYGIANIEGGGRSSARETIGRVAASAVAKQFLSSKTKMQIIAYVKQVYNILAEVNPNKVRIKEVESNIIRCPDKKSVKKMIEVIEEIRKRGDSVGGAIECVVRNVPAGLGEPVFDKLHCDLAKAVLSIPAARAFEIGSGFNCVLMTGKQHNDEFVFRKGKIRTRTNFSGGIQGGISNGENIIFRVYFKPPSTIKLPQKTVSLDGDETEIAGKGRYDPCVLPRAVPIVEAMTAIVLADHFLRARAVTPI